MSRLYVNIFLVVFVSMKKNNVIAAIQQFVSLSAGIMANIFNTKVLLELKWLKNDTQNRMQLSVLHSLNMTLPKTIWLLNFKKIQVRFKFAIIINKNYHTCLEIRAFIDGRDSTLQNPLHPCNVAILNVEMLWFLAPLYT